MDYLTKYIYQRKKEAVYLFIFGIFINLLGMFIPLYNMQVLDKVLSSGSKETLVMLSIITIIAIIVMDFLDLMRKLILIKISDWVDINIVPSIIKRSISVNLVESTNISAQMLRDVQNIKGFITGHGIISILDIPFSLIYVYVIFYINPLIGWLAVVAIIFLLCMAYINEKITSSKISKSIDEYIANAMYIDSATRNAQVLEAMGITKYLVNKWFALYLKNKKHHYNLSTINLAVNSITKIVRIILQIAVIGLGAYSALTGKRTAGGIIACSILMGKALSPFEMAITTWKTMISARKSYKKISLLMADYNEDNQQMKLPAPEGLVEFDRVIFTPHRTNVPTIKGISFTIKPGESVAIIGPSASGKSTLLKLATGIWKPINGNVRIDKSDVYYLDKTELGKSVGYLPQDVELFNASIKENIARMRSDIDPLRVVKAAKIADVHDDILSLPNGYDTVLGPMGIELSGGQKQRIAIARLFYADIRIAILDEPNSNLDQRGELALLNVIKFLKSNNITTIITTHRLSLINYVDRIAILNNGNLISYGDRDEIIKNYINVKE